MDSGHQSVGLTSPVSPIRINLATSLTKGDLPFTMHGAEYQSLRRLVRKCRVSLTAINESDTSMLNILLPLSLHWLPIYHGLLALCDPSPRFSSEKLGYYQAALTALQQEMASLQANPLEMASYPKVLASSYLLTIFSLSQCDGAWAQHARAIISMIRVADLGWLRTSDLGKFLIGAACHMDISAFAVGRSQRSQKAWLSWMMRETELRATDDFSTLETISGYPESLLSIIAQISELADDAAYDQHQASQFEVNCEVTSKGQLERSISAWTPPCLPLEMSSMQNSLLRLAWETIRRAAQIFLWRGAGFCSNILVSLPPETELRKNAYVREVISNVDLILATSQQHQLSIGNSMLWPITVAACECSLYSNGWDADIVRLLQSLVDNYSMKHPAKLGTVLESLWKQHRAYAAAIHSGAEPEIRYLSLEQVTRHAGLTIPLF